MLKLKPSVIYVFLVGSVLAVFISMVACKKEKAPDYRLNYIGNYQFTNTVSYWDDFGGSGTFTDIDTGEIVLFTGHNGNHADNEHKIGIILDNTSQLLDSWETSCFNDLPYGAYDYIHPTVSLVGTVSYPEYECFAWGYQSYFSGQILGDSISMSYGYSDASHGKNIVVYGKKIN